MKKNREKIRSEIDLTEWLTLHYPHILNEFYESYGSNEFLIEE